jgi:uncharacterized protein DUF1841
MLFTQDRRQLRAFFAEAWHKSQTGAVMEPMEALAGDIIREHPEFHAMLAEPDSLVRDYRPDHPEGNPFMHLSLHLALHEQIASDRPAGVREVYQALLRKLPDPHAARHRMMECLAESLWEAMTEQRAPDEAAYLQCLRRQGVLPR